MFRIKYNYDYINQLKYSFNMLKKLHLFSLLMLLYSMNVKSQNKEALAVAGAGLIAAGVVSAIAVEQMKEAVELTATEYILKNHKDMYAFNLSVIGFNINKSSDLSNTSVLSFGIQSLDPNTNKYEKYILLMFVSKGWFNEFGVNVAYTKYKLFNKREWDKLFMNYCNLAIANPKLKVKNIGEIPYIQKTNTKNYKENDSSYYKVIDEYGREITYQILLAKTGVHSISITKSGLDIKENGFLVGTLPFYKLSNDSYLVREYSDEFKIVYNEKSLGLFIKEMGVLTQLHNEALSEIYNYFNN